MTRILTVVGSAGSRWNDVCHAIGGEQALQRRAGFVGADHRQQRRLRAECGRVARDVGRAAGALLASASTLTMGTGASGDMRSTSPNQ